MIQKHYTYTGDDLKNIRKVYSDLKKNPIADFVGEDGSMACASSSLKGALIKFRRAYRDNGMGETEAMDLREDCIEIRSLILPEKDEERYEHEWFVGNPMMYSSDYKVYYYNI